MVLSAPYRLTKEECQWRLAFGPSCIEFVYPGCWHFDKGEVEQVRLMMYTLNMVDYPMSVLLLSSRLKVVGCLVGGWPTAFQCQPKSLWFWFGTKELGPRLDNKQQMLDPSFPSCCSYCASSKSIFNGFQGQNMLFSA